MKNKLYLILLFIFSFFLFGSINASELKVDYIGTLSDCGICSSRYLCSSKFNVQVYKLYGSNLTYTLRFHNSMNYIRVLISTEQHTSCSRGSDTYLGFSVSYSQSIYDFEINTLSSEFSYVYIAIYPDDSVEWLNLETSSDTTDYVIPKADISDSNFYLFFNFNDIVNFDVFNDYNFTDFTDFQKIIIVLLINILFILFLGFIIYILLKALYKLFSWVFR